jgi:hypothetical protein
VRLALAASVHLWVVELDPTSALGAGKLVDTKGLARIFRILGIGTRVSACVKPAIVQRVAAGSVDLFDGLTDRTGPPELDQVGSEAVEGDLLAVERDDPGKLHGDFRGEELLLLHAVFRARAVADRTAVVDKDPHVVVDLRRIQARDHKGDKALTITR